MSSLKSPRPTPKFFENAQQLSTKKVNSLRGTPRDQVPPKPPVKSAPPISRIFHKNIVLKALPVSFRNCENSMLSKHYDEKRQELYFDQCFEVIRKLGTGSFGEVFEVRSKEDGKHYAIKRSRERFRGDSDRKRKLEEVRKHEQLPKHQNCIHFFEAWEERQHLYIQTELCEMSLTNITDQYHDIPEAIIWKYLVDLLLAVQHLHKHDLIHLDIKPDNIFISRDDVCKLGDFGLVVDLTKGDNSEAQEGDPKYIAPELMEGKFTKAADIFSLGITILELACDLELPPGGDTWHQLRRFEIPMEVISNISSDLVNIIQLMMWPEYRSRPAVEDILEHPAVKKVYRTRKRELYLKHCTAKLFDFWLVFLHLLHMIWLFILWPKRYWSAEKQPFISYGPHPSEWDLSLDDDIVFDDSFNKSHGSVFLPNFDSSSSGDSKNGTLEDFQFCDRPVNSTPTKKCFLRPVFNIRTPKHLNNTGSFRTSPTHSSPVRRTSVLNSSPLGGSNIKLEDELDDSFRASIGAKNLMEMFDSVGEFSDND